MTARRSRSTKSGAAVPAVIASEASGPTAPAWHAGTSLQELVGVTDDGRLVLWSTGRVRPISVFPRLGGGLIQSDHYVLDWDDHDVTVHCSNAFGGGVIVQVMCSTATPAAFPLSYVEARLRGHVVRDPEAQADILRRLENINLLLAKRCDTPSRQRGRLGDQQPSRETRPMIAGKTLGRIREAAQ